MAFAYERLSEDDKTRVKNRFSAPDPEPDYDAFLTAWEEEHFSHSVLRDEAVKNGDEDAAGNHQDAMATLEASIANVRAGKRPDGTDRPPAPTPPPAPAPTPTPTEPVAPAPTDPARADPTRPTGRV